MGVVSGEPLKRGARTGRWCGRVWRCGGAVRTAGGFSHALPMQGVTPGVLANSAVPDRVSDIPFPGGGAGHRVGDADGG